MLLQAQTPRDTLRELRDALDRVPNPLDVPWSDWKDFFGWVGIAVVVYFVVVFAWELRDARATKKERRRRQEMGEWERRKAAAEDPARRSARAKPRR